MSEYRIEYTITRATDEDDEDFVEIGFGSSGTWGDLEQCPYSIESYVGNGQWETTGDMPSCEEVMAEIQAARWADDE